MQCPRCQQENPQGARFCNACGARLEVTCPACGSPNPAGSRFCLVFEDLHWIDSETQALLDGVVEILPTARVLLLATPAQPRGQATKEGVC